MAHPQYFVLQFLHSSRTSDHRQKSFAKICAKFCANIFMELLAKFSTLSRSFLDLATDLSKFSDVLRFQMLSFSGEFGPINFKHLLFGQICPNISFECFFIRPNLAQ